MGKRKTKKVKLSNAQLRQRRRGKLDKEFLCHFCQHERSVAIKIDMQSGLGLLNCRICGVKFSTRITSLDEPIDVYTVWIDRCRASSGTVMSLATQPPAQTAQAPVPKTQPTAAKLVQVVGIDNGEQSKPSVAHTNEEEYIDFRNLSGTNRSNRILEVENFGDAHSGALETLEDLFGEDE
ncbi:bifunctional Transcription elongation factor 1 superfamily/Transcription elongation factor 1 [Babesia duncani]|uniref:Transcription elongation factor 1 homolog n=1 Tax=Babesia duncani TaxID=323732 RepID=A0AAD9UNR3_9APIC|nr:bifunctional Transcription elongation factor 1 superfamily/Transcription elongation factor 1 [Babesia duncani]